MAKTDYSGGTEHLTPALMALYFGTVGGGGGDGHIHNGADDDGSCPILTTSGTIAALISDTYYTTEQTFDIQWEKLYNTVILQLPYMVSSRGSGATLQISPATTWPAAILPDSFEPVVPLEVISNSNGHIGKILIPDTNSEDMILSCPDASGVLSAGNFNPTNKGFRLQSIFYSTKTIP
jgi:hypothetical protein